MGPSDSRRAGRRRAVALVIDAVAPYHHGGREARYHELTRRLSDRASIDVYTMRWWQGPAKRVDGDVTYHAISKLRPMYANGRRALPQAMFFALGCFRLLGRDFDVLDADHIPYCQIPVLRLIATVRRKRFVVTWHEVWGPEYWREYLGRLGRVAWSIEWLAMRLPDHIIAASPETADRLRSILGTSASITVAPNGVDLQAIRNASPDTSVKDIVVVGRLISHKRVEMLLDALALLHADGVPATCRVIGDGPARQELHDRARALGVIDSVDFRHEVREQKDLYSLIKAARIAAFPSDREGFGAAVLEALACGLPVVTTSAPDNLAQHLVARSARGVVCDPSAQALADSIKGILIAADDHGLADESWLDDYSWDATAAKVAAALRI
jgi:glycosyltransferase involved in cell wall biosynthesis